MVVVENVLALEKCKSVMVVDIVLALEKCKSVVVVDIVLALVDSLAKELNGRSMV